MLLLSMITNRTNVLLDEQTKNILSILMAKKKKTAGGVIRDLLIQEGKNSGIKIARKRSRKEVLDDIRKLRTQIKTKGMMSIREMIDYGRKY